VRAEGLLAGNVRSGTFVLVGREGSAAAGGKSRKKISRGRFIAPIAPRIDAKFGQKSLRIIRGYLQELQEKGGEEKVKQGFKRWFWYGLVWALLFLVIIVIPAMASSGESGNIGAEALALLLVGIVAPYLSQVLKAIFGDVNGLPALWLSFAVSTVLAIVALLVTGELGWSAPPLDPPSLFSWFVELALAVYGLATVIYKSLIKQPESD